MGSPRRIDETARLRERDTTRINGEHQSALEQNVEAIKRWEAAILLARSTAEQVSEWIASTAGSGPVLVLHVVWFTAWVTVNTGRTARAEGSDAARR